MVAALVVVAKLILAAAAIGSGWRDLLRVAHSAMVCFAVVFCLFLFSRYFEMGRWFRSRSELPCGAGSWAVVSACLGALHRLAVSWQPWSRSAGCDDNHVQSTSRLKCIFALRSSSGTNGLLSPNRTEPKTPLTDHCRGRTLANRPRMTARPVTTGIYGKRGIWDVAWLLTPINQPCNDCVSGLSSSVSPLPCLLSSPGSA